MANTKRPQSSGPNGEHLHPTAPSFPKGTPKPSIRNGGGKAGTKGFVTSVKFK